MKQTCIRFLHFLYKFNEIKVNNRPCKEIGYEYTKTNFGYVFALNVKTTIRNFFQGKISLYLMTKFTLKSALKSRL